MEFSEFIKTKRSKIFTPQKFQCQSHLTFRRTFFTAACFTIEQSVAIYLKICLNISLFIRINVVDVKIEIKQ
jgi:hypothetical protein